MIYTIALILAALLAVAIYLLACAVKKVTWLHEELQVASDTEHTKCMGAVMRFVGNEWAAQVLDVAASDYASATSHSDIDRIQRLVYKPGGPPVPAIWLAERAMKLRIASDWGIDLDEEAATHG